MQETTRNYWLDVLMGLLALTLGVSSFLLWLVFPRGYFPARELWVDIHKWVGLALSIAVLIHVVLHRRWLARMTRRCLTGTRGLRPCPSEPPFDSPEGGTDG